jgi:adenine-specific DNA-methyltransferase
MSHFDLFGETPPSAYQQIEFYRHEIGWANRLILSDLLMLKEGKEGD